MPLVRRTLLTPEQGAEPVVRLATDPALAGSTGTYHLPDARRPTTPISYDRAMQDRVWAASRRLVGALRAGPGPDQPAPRPRVPDEGRRGSGHPVGECGECTGHPVR